MASLKAKIIKRALIAMTQYVLPINENGERKCSVHLDICKALNELERYRNSKSYLENKPRTKVDKYLHIGIKKLELIHKNNEGKQDHEKFQVLFSDAQISLLRAYKELKQSNLSYLNN